MFELFGVGHQPHPGLYRQLLPSWVAKMVANIPLTFRPELRFRRRHMAHWDGPVASRDHKELHVHLASVVYAEAVGAIEIDQAKHHEAERNRYVASGERNTGQHHHGRGEPAIEAVVAVERLDPVHLPILGHVGVDLT